MKFDVSLSNRSYTKFDVDPGMLHQVDEALFPFNTNWKRVGVNVSGGADSAVGTATLCSIIERLGLDTEIVFLTNVRVWNNRPWAGPISVEVYEKIQSMFPQIKMTRVQNYIPPELEDGSIGIIEQIGTSGDRICTRSFNAFASYTYKLDAVYGFITANPDDEEFIFDRGGPYDRAWTPEALEEATFCPQITPDSKLTHVLPWKLITKDFIMGQYIRRGWQELLEITRSCEGDKNLFEFMETEPFKDYTEYEHGVTPLVTCGDVTDNVQEGCFWCAERDWALKRAKKIMETPL
jgi:hypothetical protein